ncbi:tryptophan-rich sensory protein [Pseudacidovorax sp. 1753]|uniref:TspO/MBR family protein n=1 Tax=unclassified Pseudacidovorax TaxID=2620592 RepID=UPI0025E3C79B|nr:TspO/MBR family protein [Pseudacidovorax sp.]
MNAPSLSMNPPASSRARQVLGLVGWLLLCFAAAGVGGLASANAAGFYGELIRPDWAPPAWLFGPVWSALYTLMAISAWLVWRRGGWAAAPGALGLFVVQLAVNASWSWFFFVWHLGAASLAVQVVLVLLVLATLVAFWRRSALAGALLLPYVAWLGFAGVLMTVIWQLNPAQLG